MAEENRVREGSLDDYNRALPVIAETFHFHREGAPDFFADTDMPTPTEMAVSTLLAEGGAFLLAEGPDRTVVGFATVRIMDVPPEPYFVPRRFVTVDALGVLEAYRRRGIGRQIMAAAEDFGRRHQASRLRLSVWEFNSGAQAMYDAIGYTTFTRSLWKDL